MEYRGAVVHEPIVEEKLRSHRFGGYPVVLVTSNGSHGPIPHTPLRRERKDLAHARGSDPRSQSF